ncbi:MAG: 30S ribosomal protein S7, partial [Dehalococcoidia bacterium]|nr:30S ribosomal protein S7 [Dehalococcoidia bacterium]
MPRRGNAERRKVAPDPRHGSVSVQMFINKLMTRGKKSTAERMVYGALELVEERVHRPAVDVFDAALR